VHLELTGRVVTLAPLEQRAVPLRQDARGVGIEDAVGVDADRQAIDDVVVGAVEQVIDVGDLAAVAARELGP
jgi:hypothetical protein